MHYRTQAAIGVNAYPLAPQISHCTLRRTAKANRFYVAMISGDGDLKSVLEQKVKKLGHVSLGDPLAYLVMHACGPKFHTVHNPIDLVNDQADDAHRRSSHQCSDCSDSTISQALEIADLLSSQALISPELRPERRLSVCGMNAALGKYSGGFPAKSACRETDVMVGSHAKTACSR